MKLISASTNGSENTMNGGFWEMYLTPTAKSSKPIRRLNWNNTRVVALLSSNLFLTLIVVVSLQVMNVLYSNTGPWKHKIKNTTCGIKCVIHMSESLLHTCSSVCVCLFIVVIHFSFKAQSHQNLNSKIYLFIFSFSFLYIYWFTIFLWHSNINMNNNRDNSNGKEKTNNKNGQISSQSIHFKGIDGTNVSPEGCFPIRNPWGASFPLQ